MCTGEDPTPCRSVPNPLHLQTPNLQYLSYCHPRSLKSLPPESSSQALTPWPPPTTLQQMSSLILHSTLQPRGDTLLVPAWQPAFIQLGPNLRCHPLLVLLVLHPGLSRQALKEPSYPTAPTCTQTTECCQKRKFTSSVGPVSPSLPDPKPGPAAAWQLSPMPSLVLWAQPGTTRPISSTFLWARLRAHLIMDLETHLPLGSLPPPFLLHRRKPYCSPLLGSTCALDPPPLPFRHYALQYPLAILLHNPHSNACWHLPNTCLLSSSTILIRTHAGTSCLSYIHTQP